MRRREARSKKEGRARPAGRETDGEPLTSPAGPGWKVIPIRRGGVVDVSSLHSRGRVSSMDGTCDRGPVRAPALLLQRGEPSDCSSMTSPEGIVCSLDQKCPPLGGAAGWLMLGSGVCEVKNLAIL